MVTPSVADLVVIGAGPGGYAAAFRAADLGLSTVLVNDEPRPGGVCLHRGCIPSKALLGLAERIFDTRDLAEKGVDFGKAEPVLDLDKIRAWGAKVIDQMAKGIEHLARGRGVAMVRGRARFADSGTVQVRSITDNRSSRSQPDLNRAAGDLSAPGQGPGRDVEIDDGATIRFKHAILASGSRPVVPKSLAIQSPRLWTSTEALAIPFLPKSILVVGGGYIGLEMATVYAALGAEVTIVEAMSGLLPGADRDLVRPVAKHLKELARGGIYLETLVAGVTDSASAKADLPMETPEGLKVRFEGKGKPKREVYEAVLVSVGRRPNTEDLGLEKTAVQLDAKSFVRVDARQQTTDAAIFAVGDVCGNPMLAHKAAREGKVAAEAAAGQPSAFDAQAIPAVVFTDPEIAWAGLTEEEAKTSTSEVEVVKFPWAASGRAVASGQGDGLTKLIIEKKSGRILGAGIVGRSAGELIHSAVFAIEMGALARDLADTIFPHPTLSETFMEAAEAFYGESVHVAPAKKPKTGARP